MHLHLHHSLPETSINCKIYATIPSPSTKRCCTFHHHLQSSTSSSSLNLHHFFKLHRHRTVLQSSSITSNLDLYGFLDSSQKLHCFLFNLTVQQPISSSSPIHRQSRNIRSEAKPKKAEGEEIQTVNRILRILSTCTNSGFCVLGHGIMKVESWTIIATEALKSEVS
ncbi:unnamed protein product [Vicia faba]|uniref:Uncharacterized protein n=1 Tax=Vicia faba TaxID=3906 RepID=A0AAV1AQZ1_VICFA|nr:unnamed protein product [Vicia faba]